MTDPGDPGAAAVAVRVADLGEADDRAALAGLRATWVAERRGTTEDPATFAATMDAWLVAEAGHRTFWLAHDAAGAPIGMVNLIEFARMPAPGTDAGCWGYLGNMFVVAERRDEGIGATLVEALLAEARARAYERIVLSPSERSVPFYRRAGFRPADELLVLPLVRRG